jgi:hypothetical protein
VDYRRHCLRTATIVPARPTPSFLRATATPAPGATAAQAPAVLIDEHFDDNRYNWTVGRFPDSNAEAEIVDGAMFITVTSASRAATLRPQQFGAIADVDETVEGSILSKSGQKATSYYALVCRLQRSGNTISFEVWSNGTFAIERFDNALGSWTTLAAGDSNGAVRPPPATNTVRAVCAGRQLTFFVNGKLLASAQDTVLTTGLFGMLAGSNSPVPITIKFDNYRALSPAQSFYSPP